MLRWRELEKSEKEEIDYKLEKVTQVNAICLSSNPEVGARTLNLCQAPSSSLTANPWATSWVEKSHSLGAKARVVS